MMTCYKFKKLIGSNDFLISLECSNIRISYEYSNAISGFEYSHYFLIYNTGMYQFKGGLKSNILTHLQIEIAQLTV